MATWLTGSSGWRSACARSARDTLSSIGFATAVLGSDSRLRVAQRPGPLLTGRHVGVRHRHDPLAAGLAEQGWDTEASATVLDALADHFDDDLERAISRLPADLLTRSTSQEALEGG